MRVSAIALAGLPLVGCASSPAPRPLPLHAVFLPLIVQESPSDDIPEEGETLRLNLEPGPIATEIARELQGQGFTRVTILPIPAGGAEGQESHARNLLWQQQAADLGGDVLVRAEVTYEPRVSTAINEKFWLNMPLFLLGGPFCYFIDDRSYEARAYIKAEFFDLTDIHDELNEDARLLEFPILGEFERVQFDFVDRAGSSTTSYAISLLVPAGLLASETENVDGLVESAAVEAIVEDLLGKIGRLRTEFLNNDLATFHIIESKLVVERATDGTVRFAVPVQLNADSRGLRDYSLKAGNVELASGTFDTAPDTQRRSWIRRDGLLVPEGEQFLRLRIVDAVGGRRSYTFHIDGGKLPE